MITYDNAGGAYFGSLASSVGTTVTTTGDRIPLNRSGSKSSANGGGWVVTGGALIVLNGTGAGQVRRVIQSTGPREWVLDAPLDAVGLRDGGVASSPSYVQIIPYRGRNIFHRNRFTDTGAFQFYGVGIENVVSQNINERTAGMAAWGQWRQWQPPPLKGRRHVGPHANRLGGEMGCGANPNLFNVFEGNEFVEGNTIVNYNTAQGANYNFGAGYLLTITSGGGAGGNFNGSRFEDLSMNHFIIFRGNTIRSNGGILIADDTENVLVEGNTIEHSDLQIYVANTTRAILLVANSARIGCFLNARK